MNSGSLVLYKGKAAIVRKAGTKISIEVSDGRELKVRPKDVALLHPGVVESFSQLECEPDGELHDAWEILAGSTTTVEEVADLAFGEFTPATALATWRFAEDSVYFDGNPPALTARTVEDVAAKQAELEEKKATEERYQQFLKRLKSGKIDPEDRGLLGDVEAVAFGRTGSSKTLRDLGRAERPESAHRFLLQLGIWDDTVNPHPTRHGFDVDDVAEGMPAEGVGLESGSTASCEQRVDLTHLAAYAIDDNESTTPDDAIGLEGDALWVHIADPASLMSAHGELDVEARERGVTLHLPEGVVHMVAPSIINECALGKSDRSPALSFKIEVDDDGVPALVEVAPSYVRVERLTYRDAEYDMPRELFQGLLNLTDRYRARREQRGAVSFDMPEVSIRIAADGEIVIEPLARTRSRGVVQEAMIMTGEATGRWAADRGVSVPYTVQEAGSVDFPPQTLSEMYAARRKMKRSARSVTPGEHAGLGIVGYTQCTSPLRRYPDLVVHQQIRAHVAGNEPPYSEDEISMIMNAVDGRIAEARYAEYDSDMHWKLAYLSRRPEWTGSGVVVGRKNRGTSIVVPELALETVVFPQEHVENDQIVDVVCTKVDLPALAAYFEVID